MKCAKCKKDTEFYKLHPVPRADNSQTYYSMFNPKRPKKQLICHECLGWDK